MLSFTNNGTRVALTGFMGVGKSSVARHLSLLLNCERVDLDSFIEEHEGRKIHDIINDNGLPFYRQIETQNLKLVLKDTNAQILSLGGGTWTEVENRKLLK
jgi:shikimate kinase